jgi:hypothetical protein
MMQFRSLTDEQLAVKHDALPWRNRYDGSRWADPGVDDGAVLDFCPRIPSRDPLPWVHTEWLSVAEGVAEIRTAQGLHRKATFEPRTPRPDVNPILTAFRIAVDASTASSPEIAAEWLRFGDGSWRQRVDRGDLSEHISHARQVLRRLADTYMNVAPPADARLAELDSAILELERGMLGPEDGGDPFYDAIVGFLLETSQYMGRGIALGWDIERHAMAIARAVNADLAN